MQKDERSTKSPALKELTLKVVHDNNPFDNRLKTAWGFAVVISGAARTILFDTGSDDTLLLENMARMGVDPAGIDSVVLSHSHADHTGGLLGFLRANPAVEVFLLKSFPDRFKQTVHRYSARVVGVEWPQQIGVNVDSTGSMGRRIAEQALVIHTERGLMVLTGCAHPGIERIVETVRASHDEDILLVMGGFHLEWAGRRRIERIVRTFHRLGVRYVAPTHCTGERATDLLRKQFGDRLLGVGVGKTIALADLK